MAKLSWLILAGCVALAGCSPGVLTRMPPETGTQVSFAELPAHPDKYLGQTKILGGEVIQVQPLGQGSLLRVDQHDLDRTYFPSGRASGGTFLVESNEWLSPSTYQPKSRVTIAGAVAGQQNGLLLLKAEKIYFLAGPRWEKYYYPVPPEWYNNDPNLEYWFTPPYFDIWRGGGRD
jgi:starvation-inducible outer membrane lipoprotein